MKEETFFEHCLRRLRAGDEDTDLKELVDQAEEYYESELIKNELLSDSERKSIHPYADRAKKGWETRRRRQEKKELEAKELAIPK